MSLMKKYIISLVFTVLLIILSSCQKEIKLYVYKDDYNLINQDLELMVYTNIYKSPYLEKDNITNIFLYDKDNKLQLEINNIKYLGYHDKKHQFLFCFNTTKFVNEMLTFNNPTIEIEYINQLFVSIKLNSLCIYNFDNINYDHDLSIVKMNGVYEEYLKCINIDLKNRTSEIIRIKDITLLNANFGADLSNLALKDNLKSNFKKTNLDYEHYNNEMKLSKNITILPNQIVNLTIPVSYYNNKESAQSGIIIEYEINKITKYKVIYNFVFVSNKNIKLEVYDVANRNS
jgi:hypothetical protein